MDYPTFEQVSAAAEELVQQRPIRNTSVRAYLNEDGTANDLVGHILLKLGVEVDTLMPQNTKHFFMMAGAIFPEKPDAKVPGTGLDYRSLCFLSWIQEAEDKGQDWSGALAKAKRTVELREDQIALNAAIMD